MGPLWEGTTLGSGVSSCSLKCGEEGVAASPRCCRRGAHSTGDQQGAGVDRRCSPHRAPLQHAGRRSLHHHRRVTVTFCDGSRRPCGGGVVAAHTVHSEGTGVPHPEAACLFQPTVSLSHAARVRGQTSSRHHRQSIPMVMHLTCRRTRTSAVIKPEPGRLHRGEH